MYVYMYMYMYILYIIIIDIVIDMLVAVSSPAYNVIGHMYMSNKPSV